MNNNMLVLEIGTEEIPAFPLVDATKQLASLAEKAFEDARIEHGAIQTFSTPRRLILFVKDLAQQSTPLITRQKGPSVEIAFDADGNPTKAAIGFARGKNLEVKDLQRGKEDGKEYVYAIVEQRAKPTSRLLPDLLSGLIPAISWPRSQRWGTGTARFSRPVRWLLALYDDAVIPVEFAGLTAGRTTRGHRLLANKEFEVADADHFFEVLAGAWVVPDAAIRAEKIRKQIADIEAKTGLVASTPEHTFTEVVNLVEHPTVLVGHFDEEFLEVPSEIITDAMLKHQRYFPMYYPDGKLSNAFLIVSNGAMSRSDVIAEGNERVVRARLDDAAFFFHEDEKQPLSAYVDKLSRVVFQEKLGTLADKTARIEKTVAALEPQTGCDADEGRDALRAAHLCKADLVTSAVIEFTSLQGVMGGYYAIDSGENREVSTAISQHYQPRFAGDELPSNFAGKMVATADKLDTVCGIFAAGQAPTSSKDPFAVRRAAIGIINILDAGLDVSLEQAIDIALKNFEGTIEFDYPKVRSEVIDFFTARLEVIAKDAGHDAKTVDAVLSCGVIEPAEVLMRCAALDGARKDSPELFDDLATAYTRAANLADASLGTDTDEKVLSADDRKLLDAVKEAEAAVSKALAISDYPGAIAALAALREPIDAFFTDVLVMDEDIDVRNARLRLLNRFVAIFRNVADIGKLSA